MKMKIKHLDIHVDSVKLEKEGRETFLRIALDADFMIDLSKDLTYDEWIYCHQMSSFIKYAGKEQEFKNYVISVCKGKNDNTLFSRFAALLKYKCGLELTKGDIVTD